MLGWYQEEHEDFGLSSGCTCFEQVENKNLGLIIIVIAPTISNAP